jgi:hypothetical protein
MVPTVTPRKGARMVALLAYVREHPGCIARDAIAATAGDNKRTPVRNGYASVARALAAGWLRAEPESRAGRPMLRLWVA